MYEKKEKLPGIEEFERAFSYIEGIRESIFEKRTNSIDAEEKMYLEELLGDFVGYENTITDIEKKILESLTSAKEKGYFFTSKSFSPCPKDTTPKEEPNPFPTPQSIIDAFMEDVSGKQR
jgi:hypothetical protein